MLHAVGDTEIFYDLLGEGPLFLAFHGGPGLDHQYLRPWLDPLCACAKLVFFDLRGQGRSGGRERLDSATCATLCADADHLQRHLSDKPAIVFGHSFGGLLALDYALRYPANVGGLVLCSTAASLAHAPEALETAASRGETEALAIAKRAMTEPTHSDEDFAANWKGMLPLYFHSKEHARSTPVLANTIFSAAAYNRALFNWLGEFDVAGRLHEIVAPVLVLSGADDWIAPPLLAGDKLAGALPHASHVVFDSSGHFPFVEEADRFVGVTQDWIRLLA